MLALDGMKTTIQIIRIIVLSIASTCKTPIILHSLPSLPPGGLPPEGQIKQPILIATAHMHWDPEFSDVKLIQTMMLMSELKKIVEESNLSFHPTTQDCNTIPMILCGDLNSLPDSGKNQHTGL